MIDSFEWIKNLKVGDEVAVDIKSPWYSDLYQIQKIIKITPTGRIKLSNDELYRPDGRKVGDRYGRTLRQITPGILEIIERQKLISLIKFDNIKGRLSLEQLKTMLKWQDDLLNK